jgi:protein-export membrane protein SecD
MNSRPSSLIPFILALSLALISGCSASADLAKPPEHGVSIVLEYTPSTTTETNAAAILRHVATRRLDRFGTKGYFESISTNKLRVTIPITDPKQIAALTNLLSLGGVLELRLVHAQNDDFIAQGKTAPDYEILTEDRYGATIKYLVKKTPEMTGARIADASVQRDRVSNQPTIMLRFDQAGKNAFAKITADNVGRQLAIVLNGKLMSAPRINERISGGYATVSGNFDIHDAMNLANVLESPLPFPVTVQVEKTF